MPRRLLVSLVRPGWTALVLWLAVTLPLRAAAAEVELAIPPQSAAQALLAFSKATGVSVLFSFDELDRVASPGAQGRLVPLAALERLLTATGYVAQRKGHDRYVVVRAHAPTGTLRGRLLTAEGRPAARVALDLLGAQLSTETDRGGGFRFESVPPGTYTLFAQAEGFRPIQWRDVTIRAGDEVQLAVETMLVASEPMQLEPLVISEHAAARGGIGIAPVMPLTATGNLDLPRSEDDALPFRIYERTRIARSGVVNLNDFLRRELLDSDASTLPPEQDGSRDSFLAGSSNLNLRGFGSDATIILVNGRRLPESSGTLDGRLGSPDVNAIPLSLVDHIEVLPASASALYNGNPVGGVINIVLRPDIEHTEFTTTYTNSLGHYDAPSTAFSLQHGRALLDDKLRLRLSASHATALPPTESELGYLQREDRFAVAPTGAIFRATPNVRTVDGQPLPGTPASGGNPAYTSVAPGADGTGGIAAFASRIGVRNLDFFDPAGGFTVSADSVDFPYGRRQQRDSVFLSATLDALPRLQLGIDTIYARTVVNRGYDVLRSEVSLVATSPLNPFGRDLIVSLNETATALGEDYGEAHLELFSVLGGALVTLPAGWHLSLDAQYARNCARYRGLAGVDPDRWQQLVSDGRYNPLRDTQVYAPPAAFYDEVLIHFGTPGRFTKLGDYTAIDTAVRATHRELPLPTGIGATTLGFDYRYTQLADYTQRLTYADGTDAVTPVRWEGRTLERVSVFGELQAPLVPKTWLPASMESLEGVLAARYTAADTSRETNLAPTVGLKIGFVGGLAFRGSATFSNRYPTSAMARRVETSNGGGPGVNLAAIFDPQRNQSYLVEEREDLDPGILPEGAVTQSAGLVLTRGQRRSFRASLDFVDTRKANEIVFLEPQAVFNLEALWPERIARAAPEPGAPGGVGVAQTVVTGLINIASRHSQSWNAGLDWSFADIAGGRLDLGARAVWVQTYRQGTLPGQPEVDQLKAPDGSVSGLLPLRAGWTAAWTGPTHGVGLEGHYYAARRIPVAERPAQGGSSIDPFWQLDLYAQTDLSRWVPGLNRLHQVTAQIRINNVVNRAFPRYANAPSGAGVQAYADWRGRTCSVSVTVAF